MADSMHVRVVLRWFALPLLLVLGCGSGSPDPSAPAPVAAPPPVDRETLMRQAAEQVKAEREKIRDRMRALGTGGVKRKELLGKKGERSLELEFEFQNKGDKAIVAAEGTIVFRDAAGAGVKKLKVPFTQPVEPGKSITKTGRFPLDQASETDKALATTDLKALQVEWIPEHYRFADGTEARGE